MDTPANIPQRVVYEISADDLQATIEAAVVRGMEAVEAKHRLPTYLDRDKVAEILDVVPQTVSRFVKEGKLKVAFYAGTMARFTMADIEAFIAENQKYDPSKDN